MTVAIVIPAHNQAPAVHAALAGLLGTPAAEAAAVVVADGGSCDATVELVRAAQQRYPSLRLVVGPENSGIGAACSLGLETAMRELGADVVVEFDADCFGSSGCIPLLLDQVRRGADVVLAARAPEGPGRLALRLLLFFPSRTFRLVTDPEAGLRAIRVRGFGDRLDLASLASRGAGCRVESLHQLARMGARIVEVPVSAGRAAGKARPVRREILRAALRLRLGDPATRRFLKFAAVGAAGFLVNAAALELLAGSGLTRALAGIASAGLAGEPSSWAAAIASECAIVSNYLLNNWWTFASRRARRTGRFVLNFLKFNLTSFGAVLLQFAGIGAAVHLIADTTAVRQAALALTVALAVVPYNWLVYNRVIWKAVGAETR